MAQRQSTCWAHRRPPLQFSASPVQGSQVAGEMNEPKELLIVRVDNTRLNRPMVWLRLRKLLYHMNVWITALVAQSANSKYHAIRYYSPRP